ncbi:MAG: histidine kinase [Saprospiraceae bacterium]|nr:histidine kinase [Saprospiraceae bacterium]
MNLKYTIIFLYFFGHCVITDGQNDHYVFKNFTERDGLCDNIVFSLLKDKNNILWVGTQNGLSRFDGKNFHTFKQKKDESSIPNNTIHSLCDDLHGNIWGGTEKGLFCFNPASGKIKSFNAPVSCYNNIINGLICDSKGDIYATTGLELLKYDKNKSQLIQIARFSTDFSQPDLYSTGKNCLLKDEGTNSLWIATAAGLYFYDLSKNELRGHNDQKNDPLFKNRVCRALAPLKNGNIVFADNLSKEVVVFNPVDKKIISVIKLEQFQPDAYVNAILQDDQGKLWVSCFKHNLLTIDLNNNNKLGRIVNQNDRDYTITSEFFWDALLDENGSVWLGSLNGISVCSPHIDVYNAMSLPEIIPELKTDINLISEDPISRNLWITTPDFKIIEFNPESKKYIVYTQKHIQANTSNIMPGEIESILFWGTRKIIISYNGAWELNPSLKRWVPLNILPEKFKDFTIRQMIVMDSSIYVTNYSEILKYNYISKQASWIYRTTDGPRDEAPISIAHMMVDNQHNLYWVAFRKYVGFYKNGKPGLVSLTNDKQNKNLGYFSAAKIDKYNNLWIGFKGVGLICVNTTTLKIKKWTEFDGWINNHVHKIMDDQYGNIWTMYFNKVSYFNPKKESFINFSIPYAENKLSYLNSMIKRLDGSILGVVGNDVFELHAEHLNQSPSLRSPGLTSVSIAGKTYYFSGDSTLFLKPSENSLVFKYGLLVDPLAYPHFFEYRLTGLDSVWKSNEPIHQAGFNNLPPGKYTFEVVAKGRNNSWVSKTRKISFIIQTPFYKTTLFLVGIVGAVILLLFLFYKYRIAQYNKVISLESKAQLLEKEKAQVMYDGLKQQLNPHFLFNSLTSLSALIETDQNLASRFLSQMSDMYRYILKNGNEETVFLREELTFVETYFGLQQTRFGNGLVVNIQVPENQRSKKIAPVTLQNMLENAIKHNIIDGDAPLIIDIFTEEDFLVVRNNLQPKNNVETSNKRGLSQLLSLYRYLSKKPVIIDHTETHFIIKIPLL